MDKKTIQIIPLTGEKEKWRMWLVKFMVGAEIKVYYVLLPVDKKIPADDAGKTK